MSHLFWSRYNQLIETLMQAQSKQPVSFMIASHNAQSVGPLPPPPAAAPAPLQQTG
jgi:hypothetical protein